MNSNTVPPDAIWNVIIGGILLLIGVRGKGYIRFGGLAVGRRFNIGASKTGRIVAVTLGTLLMYVAALEFLGREKLSGVTLLTHVTTSAVVGDAVLLLVGFSALATALFARSYSGDASELVHGISAERAAFWIRILCVGVSVICLGSGIWGLTHHLM